MPDRDCPAHEQGCLDCGLTGGMKLQNAAGTLPINIPLLYVSGRCGATLTIAPPRSPVLGS